MIKETSVIRVTRLFLLSLFMLFLCLCIASCSAQENARHIFSESVPESEQSTTSTSEIENISYVIDCSEIDGFFLTSKEDLLEELGPDYEVVAAGAEGTDEGYFYESIDLVFVFYDNNTLSTIWCGVGFECNGARAGMNFEEIQTHLGIAEVKSTYVEEPQNKAYSIEYISDNCVFRFLSYSDDGSNSMFNISRRS